MDMNELLAQYPAIAEKVSKMGKIKQGPFNKKRYAKSIEEWNRFFPEDLQKMNQEFASAEIIERKSVYTKTAICYVSEGCFHTIPVRDILWVYAYVVKESMNFIPTGKQHQVRVWDRYGDMHIVTMTQTGPFTKKSPAEEAISKMRELIAPVRPGIIFGYSQDIQNFINTDIGAVAAKVDQDSQVN